MDPDLERSEIKSIFALLKKLFNKELGSFSMEKMTDELRQKIAEKRKNSREFMDHLKFVMIEEHFGKFKHLNEASSAIESIRYLL